MKQRLVGAIVLVALAVIFLPMLLDGSGPSGPRDVAINIPDQPQPPPNRLDESSGAAADNADAGTRGTADAPASAEPQPGTTSDQPVPSTATGDGDTASNQSSAGDEAPGPGASADTSEGPAAGPEPDEAESATAQKPETDNSAAENEITSAENETTSEASDSGAAGPRSWVVQVGSFGRETNALVLRDRLRELDFDTFVERADTEQGTVWRVRVGPVSTEEEADRLSERVTAERGGPALVMKQP